MRLIRGARRGGHLRESARRAALPTKLGERPLEAEHPLQRLGPVADRVTGAVLELTLADPESLRERADPGSAPVKPQRRRADDRVDGNGIGDEAWIPSAIAPTAVTPSLSKRADASSRY